MKVIFLDCDGVLNSRNSLYKDEALEDDLILRLKRIVNQTGAKLVLSSSWRIITSSVRKLMDKLDQFSMHLSSMTRSGVPLKYIIDKGFTPTERYKDTVPDYDGARHDITYDRGAEIAWWLDHHKGVESFVILDDDSYDIKTYYPEQLVKTNFDAGLTEEDAKKAIEILGKRKRNDYSLVTLKNGTKYLCDCIYDLETQARLYIMTSGTIVDVLYDDIEKIEDLRGEPDE